MSVKIRQFGGHAGSNAGDCAVVTIDEGFDSEIIVIDTGSSKVWGINELTMYVKDQLPSAAKKPVTLITTHFHDDHCDMSNPSPRLFNNHLYSAQAASSASFVPQIVNSVGYFPGLHWHRTKEHTKCGVALLVPPDGKREDQNDQSIAVWIDAEKFSFISFGDMTKDAYLRLVKQIGPLPPATVTKYPHHGNHPNNYIDYYNDSLFPEAVLISGNSGSGVNDTITSLLAQNVGAVYCLARTKDAQEMFKSWDTHDKCDKVDKPVYICRDVDITEDGVSVGKDGTYFAEVEMKMGRRSKLSYQWLSVVEDWSDMDLS